MSMRKGICTECGSRKIYMRGGWFHNIVVAFMPPRTRVYVCGDCGYLAEFIKADANLDHVRKNWDLVETTAKRKRDEIAAAEDAIPQEDMREPVL